MSETTAHPSQEQLNAYNLGQLPPDEAVAIESHISKCEPCCDTIISLSSDDTFVGLLKEARQLPTDQTVDHGLAPASSSDQDVPAQLAEHPRYEILGLIGKGGMGDVYKARHRKMERTVALKVINRGLVRKAEAVDRFHREVKTAAQLSHPNIVTAYDADQADDFHFMVMEYVDGVDLSQTVKDRGALPVADACDYIRQAAIGLQHAHQRGMVHRDIKPHNLMVTKDGTVKILDFGLASLAPEAIADADTVEARGDLTAAGAIMGTPDFISPEQADDARTADIRSDIYSLGATLYFLLSAQPPFAEGSVMHKLKSHAESDPEPLSTMRLDVPADLAVVITRMMAKDPDERFQTPEELAEALKPFSQSAEPREIVEPPTQVRPRRWKPTFLSLTAVAAFCVATLFAGLIYYVQTDYGVVRVEVTDPSLQVSINDETITMKDKDGKTLTIRPGEQTLIVRKGDANFEFETDRFQIRRKDEIAFKVELLEGEVVVRKDGERFHSKALSDDIEVRQILDRTLKAYAECKSYRDSGVIKSVFFRNTGSPEFTVEHSFTTAFVRPDRFRLEIKNEDNRLLISANGKNVQTWWDVEPGVKKPESLEFALAQANGFIGGDAGRIPTMLMPQILEISGGLDLIDPKQIEDGKLQNDECFRLEYNFRDEQFTLWIDKQSYLVRRIDERIKSDGVRIERTTTYDPIIDRKITDEMLEFDPPAPHADNSANDNSAKVIDAEATAEFRLQKRIPTGGKTNLKDILIYHARARLSDDASTVLVDSGAILQMWDVTTGKLKEFSEWGGSGGMMGFVPESSLVYYANGGLQFWDSATGTKQGKVIPHADGPAEAWKEHYRPAVDPDGKLIATRTAECKLRLWQVNSQQPASEEFVHEDSITQLSFSSDGRWLFAKCRDEWTARSVADPKSAVGPLPDNVSLNAMYSAESQRLATFKNSGTDGASKCEITVHELGGTDLLEVLHVTVDAHIGRHCTWIDGNHLLVCGESRGRPTPSTLFLISMQAEQPIIRKETLFRDGTVTGVAVVADHRHYLVSTYRSTTCWKLGQEEHVWQLGTSEAGKRHHLHIGTGDWVLLHEKGQTTGARPAIVRSLKNGNELWRKEDVIAASANGEAFCVVDAKGIEIWTANDADTQEPRRLRSAPVASVPKVTLDQGYTILDGGKEIGSRHLVVTENDETLSIVEEYSLALQFDGAPLGIVERGVSAVYSVAGDTPLLMRGTNSTKEQGALVMHGTVEFENGEAEMRWTSYMDGGRKLDRPSKQQATVKPPPGPLVLGSTIQGVGPLLLPEDGERKVVCATFNNRVREGKPLVEYQAGCTLNRTSRPEGAGFTITLFEPDSDKPEITWEYDSKGNCESIQMASTTVMKPHEASEEAESQPAPRSDRAAVGSDSSPNTKSVGECEGIQIALRKHFMDKYPLFAASVKQRFDILSSPEKLLDAETRRQLGELAINSPVSEVIHSFPGKPYVTFTEVTQASRDEVSVVAVNLYRNADGAFRFEVTSKQRKRRAGEPVAKGNPITEEEVDKLVQKVRQN